MPEGDRAGRTGAPEREPGRTGALECATVGPDLVVTVPGDAESLAAHLLRRLVERTRGRVGAGHRAGSVALTLPLATVAAPRVPGPAPQHRRPAGARPGAALPRSPEPAARRP